MTKKDTSSLFSVCASHVQKYDPDYFHCTLFAPVFHRELILKLLAFNVEITRAVSLPSSWSVAGPMAGFIRLQWWRELIEGKDRTHEIAPDIIKSINDGLLSADILVGMIATREEELDGIKDWEHWEDLQMRSNGIMAQTIGRILGVKDAEQLKGIANLGIAYKITRMARYLPKVFYSGRCPFPQNIIEEYHLQRTDDGIAATPEAIHEIRGLLVSKATEYLKAGRPAQKLGRKRIAAILPAVLAKRDLKRVAKWDHLPDKRGAGDQLALLWSFFRGRISL